MPGSRFKRLADRTTLHVVKDLYYGNTAGKIFWGTLAAIAVALLAYQLGKVASSFYDEEIGSTQTQFNVDEMPALTICPEFVDKLLPFWNDKANESIHTFVDLIGIKELERHLGIVLPAMKNLTQNRVVTLSGVCFRFESDQKFNELQSSFGVVKLVFKLKNTVVAPSFRKKDEKQDVAPHEPYFRLYLSRVGELDLVLPSEETFQYGSHYIVLFSVNKVSRVNRRKWPCKRYTEADRFHCIASYGNQLQQDPIFSCQTPTPKTNSFDELKVKTPCNYFAAFNAASLARLNKLSYSDYQWNQICPRPCQLSHYQYTYKERRRSETKKRKQRTLIEVKASQQVRSTQTEEYFLMPIEGMLSNVGGTLKLWVGASVMSLIQVFYLVCLDSCWTKKTMKTKTDTS